MTVSEAISRLQNSNAIRTSSADDATDTAQRGRELLAGWLRSQQGKAPAAPLLAQALEQTRRGREAIDTNPDKKTQVLGQQVDFDTLRVLSGIVLSLLNQACQEEWRRAFSKGAEAA